MQFGGMPKDAKPFKGAGSGVVEIALRYSSDATALCSHYRSADGFMFCTPFRRNRRKASQPRSGTLI
jgi:hypothetical protein